MPTTPAAPAEQLHTELGRFPPRMASRATITRTIVDLTSDTPTAITAAQQVMDTLWPTGTPETVSHADWWLTPLGILCASALRHTDTGGVTHSTAAAMLGVHRGTIAQLVHRGTLDRHPDGGVSRAAVLARIHHLHATETPA